MAYDGYILCEQCRRALYLGAFKAGRFWPGPRVEEKHAAAAVLRFITTHFGHPVRVLGETPYETYLDSIPEQQWPVTVYVRVDHAGRVGLSEDAE